MLVVDRSPTVRRTLIRKLCPLELVALQSSRCLSGDSQSALVHQRAYQAGSVIQPGGGVQLFQLVQGQQGDAAQAILPLALRSLAQALPPGGLSQGGAGLARQELHVPGHLGGHSEDGIPQAGPFLPCHKPCFSVLDPYPLVSCPASGDGKSEICRAEAGKSARHSQQTRQGSL